MDASWSAQPRSWRSAQSLFVGSVEVRQPLELRLLGADGVRRATEAATLGECLACIRTGVVIHVTNDRRKQCLISWSHGAGRRSRSSD